MDMQELGAEIRSARKRAGLTLQELDNELKMGVATISLIELGKVSEVGIRKVMRVMEHVGLELIARPARHGYTLEDAQSDNESKRMSPPK